MNISNITNSCVFPLVNTKYEPYITLEESPCGISCQDPLNFFLFFTSEERARLKDIVLIISLITVFLAPFYCGIVLYERSNIKRNFISIPFSYQCTHFISSGYVLVTFTSICPYLFGFDSIICNKDEWTLTRYSFHNVPCSLTAFVINIGIRLTVFYSCALSLSLALTLHFPKMKQKKRHYHFVVWASIFIGFIPIFLAKSVYGDYYLGICTATLGSRFHLLWMNIIPFSTCVFVFCICLAMAKFKLLRQNQNVMKLLSMNEHMRSLFNRLLVYNFLQTTSVSALVGNFCYRYVNADIWSETALSIVECQIRRTIMNQTSINDYEQCITENEDRPRPLAMSFWLLHLSGLVSLLGAILFQCSLKVQRRSVATAKYVVANFTSSGNLPCLTACDSRTELSNKEVYRWNSKIPEHVEFAVLTSANEGNERACSGIGNYERILTTTDSVTSQLTFTSTIERLSSTNSVVKECLQ